MANSTLELVGFLAGTAALSYATFVAVSFVEVQKKVQAGLDDPLKYYPKQKTPPKQKAKPVAPAPPKKAKDRKSGKGFKNSAETTASAQQPPPQDTQQ